MGASSNRPPGKTQLQRRNHLVHRNAANAATKNMTLGAQLKTVYKTGTSKNKKQHAIGCKCSRIKVHSHQPMI